MTYLLNKKCVPCEGGSKPLDSHDVHELFKHLHGWQLKEIIAITKKFQFIDFAHAIAFVNRVASLAEEEGHHPDINVHNWNKVTITLSTHAVKGLSENDFIMAEKIDAIVMA